MPTMTATDVTSARAGNPVEALRQEQRAAAIAQIEGHMRLIYEPATNTEDLLTLAEILCIAESNANSILAGVAAALGRHESLRPPKTFAAAGTLQDELRAGIINSIHQQLGTLLKHESPSTMDLTVLRDVLLWANSNAGNILTGFGVALDRLRSDAVWVKSDHWNQVAEFAEMIEQAGGVGETENASDLKDEDGLTSFSMTRWNPDDLTAGAEEIPLSSEEFLFVKKLLTLIHGPEYLEGKPEPEVAAAAE